MAKKEAALAAAAMAIESGETPAAAAGDRRAERAGRGRGGEVTC